MTYARFGNSSYKYGTASRLYGAGAEDTNLRWIVLIDWNGDGVFSGENESSWCVDVSTRRGRDFYIRTDSDGKADGFERFKIGEARVTLINSDGRYDPYNSSSALYPNVTPGKYIQIQLNYNGTIYDVFAGKITDIRPISGVNPQVTISAEDGTRLLNNSDVSVAVQQNIDIDDAIGLVLDDIAYPDLWGRALDDSSDVLNYWWADRKASTEIGELADAELGTFFVAADGAMTFYSRHHSGTAATTLDQAELYKEIDVPQPWEVVRNIVKLVAHPLVPETSQTLWTLADTPTIKAGASFTVWAAYSYNNTDVSAVNVVCSLATTDFTVNTAEDGGGTNLTGSCSVTSFTDFGKTAKIVLYNGSANDGYVTLLKVRGDAITAPDASIQIAEDSTSQGTYGKLMLTIDSKWLQSTSTASDLAQWLGAILPNPQKFITVQMEAYPTKQFALELQDVVTVTISKLGVSGNYKVGSIEHEAMAENLQKFRTTLKLEPYSSLDNFWQFTTQIGVTSVFGI